MALTAMDYIEIQQLVAKYAQVHRQLLEQRLRLRRPVHAPTASSCRSSTASRPHGIQGRERLAEVSGGGSRGCKNVGWIQQGVRHLYPNHVIEATADGAKGTWTC